MTRTALALVLLAFAASVRAGDLHGVTGFDEFAEGHENIGRALTRRPSLAQDPNYLKHHPSLAHYLHDNPLARTEFEAEADDEAASEVAEHQQQQRIERNPDTRGRRRPPSELPKLSPKSNDEGGDE